MASPQPVLVPASTFTDPARRLLATLTARPGLVVVSGHPESSRLAHYFLAAPLLRGEAVLFLDGANCFNPYRLVAFAEHCQRPPGEFLDRVRLSRAFTCFQLAELVERTPAAARRYGARRVVLTGVPDIFDDQELPASEAKAVFRRALAELRRWPEQGLTGLVLSDAVPESGERSGPAQAGALGAWLRRELERQATAVYRLEETPAGLALREAPRVSPNPRKSHPLSPVVGDSFAAWEGKNGPHHRYLSPVDRADPGALLELSTRPAPRRPAGV